MFKWGLVKDFKIIKWCIDIFENLFICLVDFMVSLFNEEGEFFFIWSVKQVWFKKWLVLDLNVEQGVIVIEILELDY